MRNSEPVVLAIETSLDDTCAAVTQGRRVLSNIVASQTAFHAEYGGTVPHIAKRKHMEWIEPTTITALERAGKTIEEIDLVAVTYGPGLAPSLEVGIAHAKDLSLKHDIPLVAVNHMEGHLLSSLAQNSNGSGKIAKLTSFPGMGFLISGGHTMLVLVNEIGSYQLIGETLDDACGEAYDKVARMLKLGYPGGPLLSELAKKGSVTFDLPEPMKHRKDLNFSFSGLKTAALYELRRHEEPYTKKFCEDFAASFEHAVLKMTQRRLERALEQYAVNFLLLGGGVINNLAIRTMARRVAKKHSLPTYIPYDQKLFMDNAAMIGIAAYYVYLRHGAWKDVDTLDRLPNLSFPRISSLTD